MAGAMQQRSSSAAELSGQLSQVQAACSAACAPAAQQLQGALAVLAGENEPQAASLAASLQAVAGQLRTLPPAERELAGCVGTLSSAVGQLAAGYNAVAAMVQERHKVGGWCGSVLPPAAVCMCASFRFLFSTSHHVLPVLHRSTTSCLLSTRACRQQQRHTPAACSSAHPAAAAQRSLPAAAPAGCRWWICCSG